LVNNSQYLIVEHDYGLGRTLVLKAAWNDSFKDVIEKENISILRLSNSAGWKGDDVTFLSALTNLRGVEIYAWGIKDITSLQHVEGLVHLSLSCLFTKAPDFSDFKNLKSCFISWVPKAKSIFDCSGLSFLNIDKYPSENLQDIGKMISLKRLHLMSRKLESLSGIENFRSLEILDLAVCTKLESLAGLEKCQKLQTIEFDCCKKMYDIDILGDLMNLKKIKITDCGKVKSLKRLVSCQLLERLLFYGDTNIEDGELVPLLNLPHLKEMWYADRRHYSMTRDRVKFILSKN
jgi:hypothetical protein